MLNDNSQFNADGAGNNDHQYGFMRSMAMAALGLLPATPAGPAQARNLRPTHNYRLLSSLATTNILLVDAAGRAVHKVMGRKATAASCWLKIYDKATIPLLPSDVPVFSIELVATASFDLDLKGFAFTNGLGIAITSLAADTDATAIAAGDVLGLNISYAR